MIKVAECFFVKGYTVLSLKEELPHTGWRTLVIEGKEYKPIPVMDAGNDCIAIMGNYDLTGKEIQFV